MSNVQRAHLKKNFLGLFWFFWGINIVFSIIYKPVNPVVFIFLISNIFTLICFFVKFLKCSLSTNAIRRYLNILTWYYSVVYALAGSLCLELSLPLTVLLFVSMVLLGIVTNNVCKLIGMKMSGKQISDKGLSVLCVIVTLALYFIFEIFDFNEIFIKKYLLLLLSFGLSCLER